MKLFSFSIFLISFIIGSVIMYISREPEKEIIVYPSIDNYNKLLYKDNANHCYHFTFKENKCPHDNSKIITIPVQ